MEFELATATSLPAHVCIANYKKGPLCLARNLANYQKGPLCLALNLANSRPGAGGRVGSVAKGR